MFHCLLALRRIGEYISPVLSVLSTSAIVVHSFLRKRFFFSFFFHIHEITRVVVLYTSLRFVEGTTNHNEYVLVEPV